MKLAGPFRQQLTLDDFHAARGWRGSVGHRDIVPPAVDGSGWLVSQQIEFVITWKYLLDRHFTVLGLKHSCQWGH